MCLPTLCPSPSSLATSKVPSNFNTKTDTCPSPTVLSYFKGAKLLQQKQTTLCPSPLVLGNFKCAEQNRWDHHGI